MMWRNSLYNELIKITARPRSFLGVAAITLIIVLIEVAMKMDGLSYIQFITAPIEQNLIIEGNILNGNLMTFIILQMLLIHIPLLVAFITGDLISGEAAMGTLRILLTKPVSRANIYWSKYIAGALYTIILLIWIAILAWGGGHLLFGTGDLIILNSDGIVILQAHDVFWRLCAALLQATLALLTISTLSIFFSCFADNSIGPIVSTMGVVILFTLVGSLDVPIFTYIRPLLFTTHMAAWRLWFNDPVPLADIAFSSMVLVLHIIILSGLGLWKFNRKDILS
jgi:ABC-2 type transport system permease protein